MKRDIIKGDVNWADLSKALKLGQKLSGMDVLFMAQEPTQDVLECLHLLATAGLRMTSIDKVIGQLATFDKNLDICLIQHSLVIPVLAEHANKKKVFKEIIVKWLPPFIVFLNSCPPYKTSGFVEQFQTCLETVLFHHDHHSELLSSFHTGTNGYAAGLWSSLSTFDGPPSALLNVIPLIFDSLTRAFQKGPKKSLLVIGIESFKFFYELVTKMDHVDMGKCLSLLLRIIKGKSLYSPYHDQEKKNEFKVLESTLECVLSRLQVRECDHLLDCLGTLLDLEPSLVLGRFSSIVVILLVQSEHESQRIELLTKFLNAHIKAGRVSAFFDVISSVLKTLSSKTLLLFKLEFLNGISTQMKSVLGAQSLACVTDLLNRMSGLLPIDESQSGQKRKRSTLSELKESELMIVQANASFFSAILCGARFSLKQWNVVADTLSNTLLNPVMDSLDGVKKGYPSDLAIVSSLLDMWLAASRTIPSFVTRSLTVSFLIRIHSIVNDLNCAQADGILEQTMLTIPYLKSTSGTLVKDNGLSSIVDAMIDWIPESKMNKWTEIQKEQILILIRFLPPIAIVSSQDRIERVLQVAMESFEDSGFHSSLLMDILQNAEFFESGTVKAAFTDALLDRLSKSLKKLFGKKEPGSLLLTVLQVAKAGKDETIAISALLKHVEFKADIDEQKYVTRVSHLIQLLIMIPDAYLSPGTWLSISAIFLVVERSLASQNEQLGLSCRYLVCSVASLHDNRIITLFDISILKWYITGSPYSEEFASHANELTCKLVSLTVKKLIQTKDSHLIKGQVETGREYWMALMAMVSQMDQALLQALIVPLSDHLVKLNPEDATALSLSWHISALVSTLLKVLPKTPSSESEWNLLNQVVTLCQVVNPERIPSLLSSIAGDSLHALGFLLSWNHLQSEKPDIQSWIQQCISAKGDLAKPIGTFLLHCNETEYLAVTSIVLNQLDLGVIPIMEQLIFVRNKEFGRNLLVDKLPQLVLSLDRMSQSATTSVDLVKIFDLLTRIVNDAPLKLAISTVSIMLNAVVRVSLRKTLLSDSFEDLFKSIYHLLHGLQQYRRRHVLQLAPGFFSCLVSMLDCFRISVADTEVLVAHQRQKVSHLDRVHHFKFIQSEMTPELARLLARLILATCQKPISSSSTFKTNDDQLILESNDVKTQYDSLVKPFSKHAPFALAQFVAIQISAFPLLPSAKGPLTEAIYALLDVCDEYGRGSVLASFSGEKTTALGNAARFIYKAMVSDWDKNHKFKGNL